MKYVVILVGGKNDGLIVFRTEDLAEANAKAYEFGMDTSAGRDWFGASVEIA